MDEAFKTIRNFGNQALNLANIVVRGADNLNANIPRVQQMIQSRFNQYVQSIQPQRALDDLRVKYLQAVQRSTPPPAPTFNLSPILDDVQSYAQKAQQDFRSKITPIYNQITANLLPKVQSTVEGFNQDFQTRFGRLDQRYIQPAVNYFKDVASFAGFGETPEGLRRRENFRQLPVANIPSEEMAINFSPLGMTKVLTPSQKVAMQKMKGLLNYTDELIKRGMPKTQAQNMSFNQATKWIENFDSSANRSLRFLKEQMQEAKILKDPTNAAKEIDDLIQTIDVKKKVNLLDYFRTPDRILAKIGLKKESDLIRQKYSDYLDELPKEIDRITAWSKRVSSDANQRVFQWLDGKKVSLADNELQVATEIKSYLKGWADRLKLPADKRITDYITHIFPRGVIEKEFDPEIASLIRGKVAGSVYDPFLKQRLNKPEYLEDTWKALDAYVKRASRKFHMDQALEQIKSKAEKLEDSQYNYVKSYIDRINLRPTEIDNLIDNFIKSSPFGYRAGQRPLTVITQNARRMVYRGLLGLNVKTALLNLTQAANTYSKLGEKYTLIGYMKILQNMPKFLLGKGTELHSVGILRNNIIEDRTLNATRKFWQYADEGLFYLFNLAEKINRGAAYWGAKSKGLAQGKSEQEAIKEAIDLVRQTQFTFGSVDTPLALSSDLAKTFGQFQSFTLKQGEFLGEMVKNKDFPGLIRWIASSFFMVSTIGRLWGMKVEDLIPSVRIGIPPTLQLPYGATQAVTEDTDKYGNPLNLQERILNRNVTKGIVNYIPGGAQLRKTFEGIKAIQGGGSYTESGNLRYPVNPSLQPIIFGPNTTEEAQKYYDENVSNLGPKQTEQYIRMINSGISPSKAYTIFEKKRELQKLIDEKKKDLEQKKPKGEPQTNVTIQQLLPQLVKEAGAADIEEQNIIMQLYQEEQLQKEKESIVKDIFSLGLSEEETNKMLSNYGLNYQAGQSIILKSLNVENRAKAIKSLLTGLSNENYSNEIKRLTENGALTTAVTSEWLKNEEISYQQKYQLDSLIRQITKKSTGTGFRKLKVKKIPIKKLTVPQVKIKKPKSIKPPKIEPLKPLKIKKIKGFRKGRVLNYGSI